MEKQDLEMRNIMVYLFKFSYFLEKYGRSLRIKYNKFNAKYWREYLCYKSMMYYIKPNVIKRIISKRIINKPENYIFPKQINNNVYEGNNEIDFCITMLKDTKNNWKWKFQNNYGREEN